MKKSMIRIATIALAVVMLSTCAITSIVAGYSVSAQQKTVTATVSGFGVTVATTVPAAEAADLDLVPDGDGVLATVAITGDPTVNAALSVTAAIETEIEAGIILITIDGTAVPYDSEETKDYYTEVVPAAIADAAAQVTVANGAELVIGWSWDKDAVGTNDLTEGTLTLTVDATVSQT